MLEEIWSSSKA